MVSALKKKIIGSPGLYKLFVTIGNLKYFFLNSINTKGKGNTVDFGQSVLRKNVKVKITGSNNTVIIKDNCRLRNTTITINGNNNRICLEEKVMVYESSTFNVDGSNTYITIDRDTTIGSAKLFIGEGDTGIAIGEDCMLSRNITMNTSDYYSIIATETNERINPPKSIEIKNHVWIGNNVFVSKGAVIGNNCIIASLTYIETNSFENNTILGGIPAKHIKSGVTWSREKLPYKN